MKGKNYRRLAIVTTLLLLSTIIARAQHERFVFTTAWMAQAQFAGYYVAYERGFYKEAGLDVDIQHPTLTSSALTRLKSQQCHAAMFSLLSAMDFISQGFPLVNIFQESMNSSNMLISRWDTDPLKMKGNGCDSPVASTSSSAVLSMPRWWSAIMSTTSCCNLASSSLKRASTDSPTTTITSRRWVSM